MAGNTIESAIIAILAPYFGEKVAPGMVQLSCQSLHLDHSDIALQSLAAIAKDIEKRMSIFLGTEKSSLVANFILNIKT